jgi:hypothetical protein
LEVEMSTTAKSNQSGTSGEKKSRTPTVRSVEATRWTSLRGKMTAQERRQALRQVASKMR